MRKVINWIMERNLIIRVLFLLCYLMGCLANAQQLKIGADEWPNFTNADGTGIYFKLLKRIYSENDLDFKVDSFNRVLNDFQKNNLDIFVGVYREDVQHAIIPNWFLDTEYPVTIFYNPKITKINNVSDVKHLRVSWKRGYHFEQFISDIKNLYLVNSTETGFELLNKNRIDVFIDYPKNIPKKYKQKFLSFELVPSRHIYLAFQRNEHGKMLAKQFDEKMTELKHSGELAEIFGSEYNHSDLGNFNIKLNQMLIITADLNLSNQNKNLDAKSIESNVFNLIQAQLDNYNIEFKVLQSLVNINQYHQEENICLNNMLKTDERAKNFIFSEPSYLYMGLRLYSKADLYSSSPIDLEAFLKKRPKAKLGIAAEQNYGDEIKKQLSNINQAQIAYMPVKKYAEFSMFNGGSFDYMLQYPEDVADIWPQISEDKLYSYELKNADKYVLGHVMCSKTNSGKRFIRAYNQALQTTIQSGIFFDIQYRTVSKDSQKDFVKYFNKVFN